MKHLDMIRYEAGTPLLVWCSRKEGFDISTPVPKISKQEADHMVSCLYDSGVRHFSLCAYPAEDWNAEYSPWSAPNPMGSTGFAGNGNKTKEVLLHDLEEIKKQYDVTDIILAGYSLAGLFVLWAGLSCDIINDIICCSGSMWFEGFEKYITELEVTEPKRIYISLGGREKRTANPIMQTIEDSSRNVANILKGKEQVTAVHFELNPGGHFADACKRISRGVYWMI